MPQNENGWQMSEYSDEEIADIILEAKVSENIYWLNRAHFLASAKHTQRIDQLMGKRLYELEVLREPTKRTKGKTQKKIKEN